MDNQITEIKNETKSLVTQGEAFVIKTQADYNGTANFLKAVKGLQKRIKDTFDPIVKAAKATHTEAVAKRKEHLDPAMAAEKIVKDKLIVYTTEQQRLECAQQDKLDRQAKTEEERKKKALEERAKKAEEQGKTDKAAELREKKEDVQVAAPIAAPRVETPKGITYRENWYAEVIDKTKIPMEYLEPNMPMLNKMAKAMKDQITIPGVKFICEKIASSRSI